MHEPIESPSDARGLRVAIAVSRYHRHITDALLEAATARFLEAGGNTDDLLVVPAPGTYELTAVCRAAAVSGAWDAVLALGCVIAGETTHDRYLCAAVAQGLTDVTVQTGVPVAFGVLTCQSMDQAKARAGGRVGNKGREAMGAAIEVAHALRLLRSGAPSRVGGL